MSRRSPRTTLIILTRNEISGVRALLAKIPLSQVEEYFAVDYRSSDGTVEYFRKHEIPVLRQRKPGRGEAFRLAAARAQGEFLVFFSPDGNEDPSDIPKLIELLKKGNDLVIASRFRKGSRNEEDNQLLKWRAWANRGFTLLVNLLWHGRLSDTINGYRAIRRTAFKRLHLDATGFAIEYQMSIRALKLGLSIAEIPTREGNRIGGTSTSSAIPTGLRFLWWLLREIWLGQRF